MACANIVYAASPGSTMTSYTSAVPMRSSSTVTGSTSCPSVATTVSLSPGMRRSKKLIDEPLMMRRRTRSPGVNVPVQLAAGDAPFNR